MQNKQAMREAQRQSKQFGYRQAGFQGHPALAKLKQAMQTAAVSGKVTTIDARGKVELHGECTWARMEALMDHYPTNTPKHYSR